MYGLYLAGHIRLMLTTAINQTFRQAYTVYTHYCHKHTSEVRTVVKLASAQFIHSKKLKTMKDLNPTQLNYFLSLCTFILLLLPSCMLK